jgi:type I restriction enzyme M protein
MEAVVVVLRSKRPKSQRGKVLFVNAVDLVARERAQSFLRQSDQVAILEVYQDYADSAGLAAVATVDDIAKNGWSLLIPTYVVAAGREASLAAVSLEVIVTDWQVAARESDSAVSSVLELLKSGSGL